MYREVVVGFDLRVPLAEVPSFWADEHRRHTYLLAPEVAVPLSVDEAVWPRRGSALAEGRLEVLTPRFRTADEALDAATPDEVVIAITAWQGPGEPEVPEGRAPDPAWRRVGWDVVDGVFPSGLANCGYSVEDVLVWRDEWARHLNAHGLFDDLPAAFAFRDRTNLRVAEHAPFAVLGLYVVR